MSRCPRRAAIKDVASSGREVLTATTVRPMIRSDSPRSVATDTAAPSSRWPAYTSMARPQTIISRLLSQEASGPSCGIDCGRAECCDWRSSKPRYNASAVSRKTPSVRVSSSFHANRNTSRLAPIINGMSRRTSCRDTRNGMISADNPRVTRMLKMLLPITLLTAMSTFCARVACRLTAICGALLPRATMVRPMISGRTCRRAATRTAARTISSAPTISSTRPLSSSSTLSRGRSASPKMVAAPWISRGLAHEPARCRCGSCPVARRLRETSRSGVRGYAARGH
ncbi:hypothetical protein D3C73_915010 [compost metagenome]